MTLTCVRSVSGHGTAIDMIATGMFEDDNIEIEISVRTDKVGSRSSETITIPREEWDKMNDHERDEYILEILLTSDLIEWNYETRQH